MAYFEDVSANLANAAQKQTDLQRAVASGELWMEDGVAERAAARCEQAISDLDGWLANADRLTKRRKFGANNDGDATAERFGQAGEEIVMVMQNAQRVFASMADTYRAAGRTVAEVDAAGQQSFRGRAE